MSKPFYDMSDANLLNWNANFSSKLSATPLAFHISVEQAGLMAAAHTSFQNSLNAWTNPVTRTPVVSGNKKEARAELLAMAKFLVNAINSNPLTTLEQRNELNIKARKTPEPVPAPSVSPILEFGCASRTSIMITLKSDEDRRGRPKGTAGALIYTFVGENAPTDINQWVFYRLSSRTTVEVEFPSVESATTMWVTAQWYNDRNKTGPACQPQSVSLPAAPVVPVGVNSSVKIAA